MNRFLNMISFSALIGSAIWMYSIKYDTIYHAEQVKKLENRLDKERQSITVLQAEWQHLNRPGRLQAVADKHLNLKPLAATQIVKAGELPEKAPGGDALARKLDALITGAISPVQAKPAPQRFVPAAKASVKPQAKPGAGRAALARVARKQPAPKQASAKPSQALPLRPPLPVGPR